MRKLLFFFVLCVLSAVPVRAGGECLNMAVFSTRLIDGRISVYAQYKLTQAGLCIRYFPLPAVRSTQALLGGDIDGELMRFSPYQKLVGQSAMMVPTPLFFVGNSLVVLDERVEDLSDLSDLEVVYMRGGYVSEQYLRRLGVVGIGVESLDQMVRLMAAGRAKAIIIVDPLLSRVMKGFHAIRRVRLGDLGVHIFLHKRFAEQVPEIDRKIQAVKAQGKSFLHPAYRLTMDVYGHPTR